MAEVVGPAGAGKTTLCRELTRRAARVRLENFPDVHKPADAPFFLSNGLQLIPRLLALPRNRSRRLTRREFAWMSILNGWPALLRKEAERGGVIVLDQGPVYLLAETRLFGPEYLKRDSAHRFWQSLFERWEAALHTVFYLDADNEVLLDRIRSRGQEHIVKAESKTTVFEFLDRYRAEYEFILSALTAKDRNLRILRIDTGNRQTQAIIEDILLELGC